MPKEETNYQSNQTDSYSKLLFEFEFGEASGTQDKIARSVGVLKSDRAYDLALSSRPADEYIKTAGCDLSAIFMPFRAASGVDANMPMLNSTQFSDRQLPFQMDLSQSDSLVNRYVGPSGDSLPGVVSSDQYYGDVNQLRDAADVRSVGFRMPMVGVGWGLDKDGSPWPSGSSEDLWQDDVEQGSLVDPKNYVAAPIDFRYNKFRNTWTCDSSQVLIKNSTGSDITKYQILGIDTVSIIDPADSDQTLDDFQSDIYINGMIPSGAKHWANFVVASQSIKDGEVGLARVTGLAHAKVDIKNPNHEFADIVYNDVSKLQSYTAGSSRIIAKGSGVGEQWCALDLKASPGDLMPAMITGSGIINGSGWYTAEEIVKSDTSEGWNSIASGIVWDNDNFGEVYHPEGSNSLIPASGESGKIVMLKRVVDFTSDAVWTIITGDSLPEGSGVYKVLQLDEDYNPVWDYLRAIDI